MNGQRLHVALKNMEQSRGDFKYSVSMRVSGFTFLRNAVINGYPFEESIRSILPIVDEFICVIGEGVDDTRGRVVAIGDPKIRVIDSQWNESMQDRGFVYGQQKMIAQFNCTGDWAFYLEGDEVLHESEVMSIRDTMEKISTITRLRRSILTSFIFTARLIRLV